jgi:chromosome segregation ATPase
MAAEMKDDLADSERKIDGLTKTLTDLKSQIDVLSDRLSKVSNQVDNYDRRLGSLSNIWRQEAKRFRKGTVTIELISANFKHLLRRLAKQSNSILPLLSQKRQTPDTRDD